MLVKDLMWKEPLIISPETTIAEAAFKMADIGSGVLPVGTADKIEGIITDRDIVVRVVSAGKDAAEEMVRDHMSAPVHSCREDDRLDTAAESMTQHHVGRLAVMNDENHLTGIVSFAHVIRNEAGAKELAAAVESAREAHSAAPIDR